MRADWFTTAFLQLDRDTELVRAERINLHFDGRSKQVYLLFCIAVFYKRNRKSVLCVSIKL